MSPIANLNEAGLQSLMELPTGSWGATDLLAAREGLGLTQAELAAAIGYDRSAIAKIEGGDTPPRRVVELAVRYLVNSRPQGTLFKINAPDSARFRPFETAIGLNEAHFPAVKAPMFNSRLVRRFGFVSFRNLTPAAVGLPSI